MSDQTLTTIDLIFKAIITVAIVSFIPSYFSFKGKVEHFIGDDWHQFLDQFNRVLDRFDRLEEKIDKLRQ